MYNFQQLSYDTHEWDYASWSWTGLQPQRMRAGKPSDVVNLADVTYQPANYPGPLKYAANSVKELIHRYPELRPKAEKLHRTVSKIVNNSTKSDDQSSTLENLYRANAKMRASSHCRYIYAKACENCAVKDICDGFHGDYALMLGASEAQSIQDIAPVQDPKYFIKDQDKLIESEDFSWAL